MAQRLTPSCQTAFAFADLEYVGERYSIAFLFAAIDNSGTWPEVWTPQEGRDFAATFTAKA